MYLRIGKPVLSDADAQAHTYFFRNCSAIHAYMRSINMYRYMKMYVYIVLIMIACSSYWYAYNAIGNIGHFYRFATHRGF